MRDEQYRNAIDHADRSPAIFPALDPILLDDSERIGKGALREFECNAVFAPIRGSLYFIPLERAVHTGLLLH